MGFPLVIKIIELFIFSVTHQRHLSFTEIVKWVLPFCPNIHTLKLKLNEKPEGLADYIARLEKLIDLDIGTCIGIDPKEVTFVSFRTNTNLLTSS